MRWFRIFSAAKTVSLPITFGCDSASDSRRGVFGSTSFERLEGPPQPEIPQRNYSRECLTHQDLGGQDQQTKEGLKIGLKLGSTKGFILLACTAKVTFLLASVRN